jgi:hypothetical protein
MQPDVAVARQNLIWFAVPVTGQEQRQVCDCIFKDFMAAENLVDLERTKFIIDRLNCSVGRRLKRREGE